MVDFNVRTYSEDDGRIIGAEVTVISTSGDNLGSISVANAETLAEMQAQLAVIDETYFTEERLAEILENINESQEINATKLSGFVSSDFAKVSQLSAYAPASHTHPVSQITNLYDYQITASSYNVNIDSSVNITVKVTNRATGRPVTGVTVPVLKNNSTWKSGTTGVNGTFSLSYTADTWGLTTFSANTVNTQINVKGYKLVETVNTNNLTIKTYTDGIRVVYAISGTTTIQQGVLTSKLTYKPLYDITIEINPAKDNSGARLRIATDGGMQFIKNANDGTSCTAQSSASTFLANPLY